VKGQGNKKQRCSTLLLILYFYALIPSSFPH
jgi:hypothetical protein